MEQFMVPELLAFKSFLWRRFHPSVCQYRGIQILTSPMLTRPISKWAGEIDGSLCIPVPKYGISETINSTIRQIEFYQENEYVKAEEDVKDIHRADRSARSSRAAGRSRRQIPASGKPGTGLAYNLFWNDLVTADNTIWPNSTYVKITFLNHSVINFISTTDIQFNSFMFRNMQEPHQTVNPAEPGRRKRALTAFSTASAIK